MMNAKQPSYAEDEVLVRVEGVSKKFCRSLKRSLWYGLCDIGGELNPFRRQVAEVAGRGLPVTGNGSKPDSSEPATSLPKGHLAESRFAPPVTSPPLRDGEFWAVNDVSFELRRGECLGLIGHNGAGKTTLLKMLNGLIKPDHGRIEMNGRVGALIALGSGFNPILTGRENIYINGAVLGLSKREIDHKMDEIIDFAELRDFIDMPVQSYSSGMTVRLGFSVAISLSPDILILDEVLAVGDVRFIFKCLNRLREMAATSAVVLVTHNMQHVSGLCSRALLMTKGSVTANTSDTSKAIGKYFEAVEATVIYSGCGGVGITACEVHERYSGPGPAVDECTVLRQGCEGYVVLDFVVESENEAVDLLVNLTDEGAIPLMAVPVLGTSNERVQFTKGRHRIKVPLGRVELNAGRYACTAVFRSVRSGKILNRTQGIGNFRIDAASSYVARMVRPGVLT